MTVASRSKPELPTMTGPVPVPRVVNKRRVRGGVLALAVLLVTAGAGLSGLTYLKVAKLGSYLAVARPVAVGSVIAADDLTSVALRVDGAVRPIPARDLDRVTGLRAAVTLVPGTLLSPAELTNTPLVGQGQAQISVVQKVGELPSPAMHPGSGVTVVATPDATAGTPTGPPQVFDATVVSVAGPEPDGSYVVYLAVDAHNATTIVSLETDHSIGLVLKPAQ